MYDEYTDWGNSFDDMDGGDWANLMSGPDDHYFERLEQEHYSSEEDYDYSYKNYNDSDGYDYEPLEPPDEDEENTSYYYVEEEAEEVEIVITESEILIILLLKSGIWRLSDGLKSLMLQNFYHENPF
ncbi:MAG: hypothetical protein HQK62_01175 [Desulfamplus sp.]|nr:hypothetical protein [Desulfamplus sp.]